METGDQSMRPPDLEKRYTEITSAQYIIKNKIRGIAESVVMLERYMLEYQNEEALGLTRIIGADLDVLEIFFKEELGRPKRETSDPVDKEGVQPR